MDKNEEHITKIVMKFDELILTKKNYKQIRKELREYKDSLKWFELRKQTKRASAK